MKYVFLTSNFLLKKIFVLLNVEFRLSEGVCALRYNLAPVQQMHGNRTFPSLETLQLNDHQVLLRVDVFHEQQMDRNEKDQFFTAVSISSVFLFVVNTF